MPDPPITRLAERAAYQNRFATVYDDDVKFGDGRTGSYLRIVQSDGSPGVAVLPIAEDQVAMVRVYRYPTDEWEWGIPRGLAQGGDPEATARQELIEELGVAPARLMEFGCMTPDSGLLSATVHVYAAEYYRMPPPLAPRDREEVSDARWWPKRMLTGAIVTGQVKDGFTLAAVCYAVCWGLIPPFVMAGTASRP